LIRANVNNASGHKPARPNVFEKAGYLADGTHSRTWFIDSAALAPNLDSKRAKTRFNCRFDSGIHRPNQD
jgi:hypothetical protein